MKNFVIAGTSGVGKTYLEEYLDEHNICFQLPKYFDRPARKCESKTKNISLNKNKWHAIKNEFFFTLTYNTFHYGWKTKDLKKHTSNTLAITLDSLKEFLNKNNTFIPILLWIDTKNLHIIEKRMKARKDNKDIINKRLSLASSEIKNIL